jgi:ATP-dependent DNA ligase
MLIERMRKRLVADRASFIEPCLPSPADKPPSGSNWIHEIKHDGFRVMARRDPVGIRLITRRGNDWTTRYGPGRGSLRRGLSAIDPTHAAI